jgi:hypothetical protein
MKVKSVSQVFKEFLEKSADFLFRLRTLAN